MEPPHDCRNKSALAKAAGRSVDLATAIAFAEYGAAAMPTHIDEADLAAGVAMTLGTSGHLAPRQLAPR